jgi:hypothetical protein
MTTEVCPAATTPTFFALMKPLVVSTPVTAPSGVLRKPVTSQVGGAGVAPGDGVVPGDAAAPLEGRADDRIARRIRDIEGRAEHLGFFRRQPLVVDAVEAVGVDVALGGLHVVCVVGEHHDAARRVHDVVVEFGRQVLPQLERVLIQGCALVVEVVRADDRGVAPGVAAAEPALLDHGDVGEAVLLRQVVGCGEAMAAAADDDTIVAGAGLRRAPLLFPVLVAGQRIARERQDREFHACLISECSIGAG